MRRTRRLRRTIATDPRPRLVLALGGALLAVSFLFPRWYVDFGQGWQVPTKASSNRAFIFIGPKAPIKTMRTYRSRGEFVSMRIGKVVRATPDWKRAFKEGFWIILGTSGLWWVYRRRGMASYAATGAAVHPR